MNIKKVISPILRNPIISPIRQWLLREAAFREERQQPDFQKRSTFYASFLSKNDLCFDVGANLGNRVGPLLALGAKVVAIEPQASCYKVLRTKYGRKIKLVTKGLGAEGGTQNFYISDAHTISSFSKEFVDTMKEGRFKNYTWQEPVKVEVTTLDALIQKYGVPSFIKIDVEGYELEVLKGLSSPVNMISFEYTVPEQTNKVIDCIQQIEKNGAKIECNYSIGESMDFTLAQWLPSQKMKNYVLDSDFINTEFGDVYCRVIPS